MTAKIFAAGLLLYLGLTSCNQASNKQQSMKTKAALLVNKEAFTLYKKTDSVIYVVRALAVTSDTFDLHLYHINISKPENAQQLFASVQRLTKQEIDKKKAELETSYTWAPFKNEEILFVQIQPSGSKDEMQLLDKRQEVEDKLREALENNNLGKWIAGDLGPGGANMLFTVSDVNKSLQTVMSVLQENDLEKNVLIGRRVSLDKADWFYEVIYPVSYSGHFNTM
jgi:hypothetical protein